MPRPEGSEGGQRPALRPPRESAASRAAWDFGRVEEFWERWRPLTPWGREAREARSVPFDRSSIEAELDRTEAWSAFSARCLEDGSSGAARLDRIAWHLGRIPRLPEAIDGGGGEGRLDLVEIFVAKKFINNYNGIFQLLDEAARSAFGFHGAPGTLVRLLESGGADGESFGLGEGLDARLGPLRAAIAALDAELGLLRRAGAERAFAATGIDLAGRDFALVAPASAGGPDLARGSVAELFEIEAWDGDTHALRLRPTPRELALADERARLIDEERAVEAELLGRLSSAVLAEREGLRDLSRAVSLLDLARSRALLAFGPGFCRPEFRDARDAALDIGAGRLLPLEAQCAERGAPYTPLDLELPERAALIFGSNMGGKTVALETALFLQILAQCGFHVPARRFASRVYPLIHYVGEGGAEPSPIGEGDSLQPSSRARGGARASPERRGGLSGFGREIRSFVESAAFAGDGAFLCFDEFARTTGSSEAEALLSGVLGHLSGLEGVKSLFTTHFRGVATFEGLRRLRVRGLDRVAARSAVAGRGRELLQAIDALMRYELVEDSGESADSDAILIAALLGLDPSIVDRAARHYDLWREGRKEKGQ